MSKRKKGFTISQSQSGLKVSLIILRWAEPDVRPAPAGEKNINLPKKIVKNHTRVLDSDWSEGVDSNHRFIRTCSF